MTERGAEVMAAMLDIFDQEKVWEMALKAERREGREEGLEKGMEKGMLISLKNLMKNTNWPLEKAMDVLQISGDDRKKYSGLKCTQGSGHDETKGCAFKK